MVIGLHITSYRLIVFYILHTFKKKYGNWSIISTIGRD